MRTTRALARFALDGSFRNLDDCCHFLANRPITGVVERDDEPRTFGKPAANRLPKRHEFDAGSGRPKARRSADEP